MILYKYSQIVVNNPANFKTLLNVNLIFKNGSENSIKATAIPNIIDKYTIKAKTTANKITNKIVVVGQNPA